MRRLTAVELFAGVGGMALGFEQAGFDVLAAVDLDPIHLSAHERNFPLCEPVCADVRDVGADELLEAAQRGAARRGHPPKVVDLDCVFGGPSCQGFSVIGPRKEGDPRNALVAQFARVVADLQPRWFVMENVPGLTSASHRSTLNDFYRVMRNAGYTCREPVLVNAKDHGVPQERKRVFIIGARTGQRLPEFLEPVSKPPTISEAIGDLPALARFRSLYVNDYLDLTDQQLNSMLRAQSEYVRALNGFVENAKGLEDGRLWEPRRLTSVGLTRHSDAVVARFRRLVPGFRDEVGRLPKLIADGQAPTLRAGTGRDHGSFTSARPVHHSSPRVITVREAARLHGFPDWFGFHSTKWHGFRQVGNSVPPPLARSIAKAVVNVSDLALGARGGLPLHLGPAELLRLTLDEAAQRHGLDSEKLPKNVRAQAERQRREAA